MGNLQRLSQRQSPIPELVVGVRNLAAASVCKDRADAAYFSLDRFSLRARALREHVGKRWIVGLLSVMEKKRQHIGGS